MGDYKRLRGPCQEEISEKKRKRLPILDGSLGSEKISLDKGGGSAYNTQTDRPNGSAILVKRKIYRQLPCQGPALWQI